jgi:hypothetical protein
MAGNFSLKFNKSENIIARQILTQLASRANSAFGRVAKSASLPIKDQVEGAILDCPEINSLQGGKLLAELGLPSGIAATAPQAIARAVSSNVFLTPTPVKLIGDKLVGGLELGIMPETNWPSIWGISQASFKYYSRRYKKSVKLDWLYWLLFMGDTIIVNNFEVEFGSFGRTGMGRMTESDGAGWKISSNYSGTQDDNFITRALEDPIVRNNIIKVLSSSLQQSWGGK